MPIPGRDLPFLSRVLLEWGELINAHGLMLLALLGGAAVLGVVFLAHVRRALAAAARRIPAIGARILVYHLARMYRTVGMLLRGGTPIVTALTMVAGLLPEELRERLSRATVRIREGASISVAMAGAGLVTPVAGRMLRVGEKSGDMAEMMERIARLPR